jgi:hypothetical protein
MNAAEDGSLGKLLSDGFPIEQATRPVSLNPSG